MTTSPVLLAPLSLHKLVVVVDCERSSRGIRAVGQEQALLQLALGREATEPSHARNWPYTHPQPSLTHSKLEPCHLGLSPVLCAVLLRGAMRLLSVIPLACAIYS